MVSDGRRLWMCVKFGCGPRDRSERILPLIQGKHLDQCTISIETRRRRKREHVYSGTGLLSKTTGVGVRKIKFRHALNYLVGSIHFVVWGWS